MLRLRALLVDRASLRRTSRCNLANAGSVLYRRMVDVVASEARVHLRPKRLVVHVVDECARGLSHDHIWCPHRDLGRTRQLHRALARALVRNPVSADAVVLEEAVALRVVAVVVVLAVANLDAVVRTTRRIA